MTRRVDKFLRLGLFVLVIFSLASCSATIFRTPKAIGITKNKLAFISIPKTVLLVRINDHRFGRCYADIAKKCAA